MIKKKKHQKYLGKSVYYEEKQTVNIYNKQWHLHNERMNFERNNITVHNSHKKLPCLT